MKTFPNTQDLINEIQKLSQRVSLLEAKLSSKTTNDSSSPFSATKNTNAETKFTPMSPLQVDALVSWKEKYYSILSDFEMQFLGTLISYKQISDKQANVLAGIKDKIQKTKQFQETNLTV